MVKRILIAAVAGAFLAGLALAAPVDAAPRPAPSAQISTQTSAPTTYPDGVHVAYRTASGHVHVTTTPDTSPFCACPTDYTDQDATLAAGSSAKAVGTPFGFISTIGSLQEHVVFRTAGGHVHDLWRNRGKAVWHDTDLTAKARTKARAAGDVVGWSDDRDGLRFVAYRGTDRHLHVLSWRASTHAWVDVDLTRQLHVKAKVASDPTYHDALNGAAAHPLHFRDALVYRSADGHVHQVLHVPGTWSDQDVWAAAHATVAAAGRPNGFFSSNSSPVVAQDHVLMRGKNRQIYELRHDFGHSWKTVAISKQAKAPLASGDPSGTAVEFYDNFAPGQTVEYTDGSHHRVVLNRHTGSRNPDDPTPPPPTNDPWTYAAPVDAHVRALAPVEFDAELREAWVSTGGHLLLRSTDLSVLEQTLDDLTALLHAPHPASGASAYRVFTV